MNADSFHVDYAYRPYRVFEEPIEGGKKKRYYYKKKGKKIPIKGKKIPVKKIKRIVSNIKTGNVMKSLLGHFKNSLNTINKARDITTTNQYAGSIYNITKDLREQVETQKKDLKSMEELINNIRESGRILDITELLTHKEAKDFYTKLKAEHKDLGKAELEEYFIKEFPKHLTKFQKELDEKEKEIVKLTAKARDATSEQERIKGEAETESRRTKDLLKHQEAEYQRQLEDIKLETERAVTERARAEEERRREEETSKVLKKEQRLSEINLKKKELGAQKTLNKLGFTQISNVIPKVAGLSKGEFYQKLKKYNLTDIKPPEKQYGDPLDNAFTALQADMKPKIAEFYKDEIKRRKQAYKKQHKLAPKEEVKDADIDLSDLQVFDKLDAQPSREKIITYLAKTNVNKLGDLVKDYIKEYEPPLARSEFSSKKKDFNKLKKDTLQEYPDVEQLLPSDESDIGGEGRKIKEGTPTDEGLWNYEIDFILKKYKPYLHYLGTVPREKVPELLKNMKGDKFSLIYNTAKTSDPPSAQHHWIALCCFDGSVELYNPLGLEPIHPDIIKAINEWCQERDYFVKPKFNSIKDQSAYSSNCGWICIRFLLGRTIYKQSFAEASGWNSVKESEADITKLKQQYGFI